MSVYDVCGVFFSFFSRVQEKMASRSGRNIYLQPEFDGLLCVCSRIQQIQLLGRDMRGAEHDKLWNQLEAEIHLHRHKTVIRACRGRANRKKKLPTPPGHVSTQCRALTTDQSEKSEMLYSFPCPFLPLCVCVCVCV